jgi:putative ABC transport system permease protein
MRASLRQLAGGATAIVVATAFIAAAMAGSAVMSATMHNIMKEPYARADLVIASDFFPTPNQRLPGGSAEDARANDLVADAFSAVELSADASFGERSEWISLRAVSTEASLATWPASEGREPTAAGEASVAESVADRLGLALGDQFEVTVNVEPAEVAVYSEGSEPSPGATAGDAGAEPTASDNEDDPVVAEAAAADLPQERSRALTVTGLFDDSSPSFSTRPEVQTPLATIKELGVLDGASWGYASGSLLIDLAVGAPDSPETRAQLGEALASTWTAQGWANHCEDGLAVEPGPGKAATGRQPGCTLLVMSPDQAAELRAAAYGEVTMVTSVALIFGLVSLLTGAMVIANTFQVMIAGRARTLALLRAVGATRNQIRRSVLFEALVVGLAASGIGVLAGWALIQAALVVATDLYPTVPMPAAVDLAPWAVTAALAIGTATTVLASLVPARLATRVAPVDALRPQEEPTLSVRAGRSRMVWSIVLASIGVLVMALALFTTMHRAPVTTVVAGAIGVVGGALLAAGVIIGTVFWLPKVVGRMAGWIAKRAGGARIAAANVVRNPRRTAASATALMIAVTLVSSMLVAAAGITRGLDRSIEDRAPFDLQLGTLSTSHWLTEPTFGSTPEEASAETPEEASEGTPEGDLEQTLEETPEEASEGAAEPTTSETRGPGTEQAVSPELINQIEAVPGVTGSAPISSAQIVVEDDFGVPFTYIVNGVEPERLREALADSPLVDQLGAGVVLVDDYYNDQLTHMSLTMGDISEDEPWVEPTPEPISGSTREVLTASGEPQRVTFVYSPDLDFHWGGMLANQATLDALGSGETVAVLFKVAGEADPIEVNNEVRDLVTESSPTLASSLPVDGAAVEKAEARKTISTMLLIGVALLAVSVLVALVGVGNTLSLSVIERRHENALLRALGLSRGQTRWMMAVEALVISGVAGLMGILFGTVYGFVACALLMFNALGLSLVFPGLGLAVVFGLTLTAGLAASVLPGRRAARTSPAEALVGSD